MFHVVLEHQEPSAKSGPFHVEVHFMGEIKVSPAEARRRAAGFLGTEVSMMILAKEPTLVVGERPFWQSPACLYLPELGEVATVGSVDVDALTGEVIAPSPEQIVEMQNRANVIASRLTPATAPAG